MRQISEWQLSREENQIREPRGRTRRWGRLEVGWPVSLCGSSDYRKCVPSMGSTRVQENAEDQGVRRQKEEPNKITKKENKKEEQTKRNQEKEKPPASIEGNLILAGGKILRLRSE